MAEVVSAAGLAGFDLISLDDHVWVRPIIGGPLKGHIDAYTGLGFIAAHTRKVRLLALAAAAPYRPAACFGPIARPIQTQLGSPRCRSPITITKSKNSPRALPIDLSQCEFARGVRYVRLLLDLWLDHYNRGRPHMALDLATPNPRPTAGAGKIVRERKVFGLTTEYSRAA